MDRVVVGIASIPSRESSLRQVIKSLQKQTLPINKYYIYLNGYDEIPYYYRVLYNPDRYNFFLSAEFGDLGDAGKFFKVGEEKDSVYFSIDDDLVLPHNYIEFMLRGLKKYNNQKIVSLHGSIFNEKINNYYRDRRLFNFKRTLLKDIRCHLGGTGLMCFDTNNFKLSITDFPKANYADLFVGLQAQKQKKSIVVLAHRKNFVKPILNTTANSIFQRFIRDENRIKEGTDIVNTLPKWELH